MIHDQDSLGRAYADAVGNYRYVSYVDVVWPITYTYHCWAKPEAKLAESKRKIKREETDAQGNKKVSFPIAGGFGTSKFTFPATSLVVVKALPYNDW